MRDLSVEDCLAEPRNPMNIFFANERVPNTKTYCDMVKGLQIRGTRLQDSRRDDLAKQQATPFLRHPRVAKGTERQSEKADERRDAKARDLNSPTVFDVTQVLWTAETENERNSLSSGHLSGRLNAQSVIEPEQSASSGVKCYARVAELLDDDVQGGKFQQVKPLPTID